MMRIGICLGSRVIWVTCIRLLIEVQCIVLCLTCSIYIICISVGTVHCTGMDFFFKE